MVVASRGRGGYTVVWQICPRRWPAISGVGSFAVGPLRPSLHLLVVRVILRSRGWPSPSCGPSLVSRPELQDGVRLAPGSRTELISRPATEQSSSCARQQDGARLAPGGGTELVSRSGLQDRRWRPVLASLWVSALGVVQGCERRGLFARLFGWGSGESRVRWCLGLGCQVGGPGGGSAVLLGRARGLVLHGGHGRAGGVTAGMRRSVVVRGGRGENLFFLRTNRRRRNSFPS